MLLVLLHAASVVASALTRIIRQQLNTEGKQPGYAFL